MRPSFLLHIVSGTLLFISVLLLFTGDYFKNNTITTIWLFMIMSIAIGIQALMNYQEEIYYKFNPLEDQWTVYDTPREPKP
jgi:O-antigen/teichoic acid export membrane protein